MYTNYWRFVVTLILYSDLFWMIIFVTSHDMLVDASPLSWFIIKQGVIIFGLVIEVGDPNVYAKSQVDRIISSSYSANYILNFDVPESQRGLMTSSASVAWWSYVT